MRKKWYIPIAIFVILVIIYFIRGIFVEHVKYETLREGAMEEMVSSKGILIKYETLYETGAGGTVEAKVASGARVSKGALLANIYSGEVDSEVMARLDRVNKKIDSVNAGREEGLSFSSDITKLDSEINVKVNEIVENGQKNNLSKVSELKTSLAVLAERRALISGQTGAARRTLDELESLRNSLLKQIGVAQKELRAGTSGVFVSQIDGLEQLITPYNMDVLTPSKVKELGDVYKKNHSNSENDDSLIFTCKVVDNFRYFIAINIPAAKATNLRAGQSVSLRFNELSSDIIDAKVYMVSTEEGGDVTVICECNKFLNDLLEKRTVSVDFIRKRYEGYRISVSALHTREGVVGIFAKRDGVMRFIPVNILYNTQDIAIVSSADGKKPLRLYDEVVVRAAKYEEGMFIN